MTMAKEDKTMTKTPWLIQLTAEDNSLAPVVSRGATVSIDCSERDLVDGGIYAIKDGDRAALWLFHEGFAGMSLAAGGIAVGTLSSLAGGFRCSGPVAMSQVKIVGRVVDVPQESALGHWSSERALLVAALDECRGAIRRQSGHLPEIDFVSAQNAQETLTGWKLRFDEIMANNELAKRFALEQRIDALNARLMYIEDRIAESDAESAADVAAKLQVLWDLHYAPFPATHGDLAARIVATSLRCLKRTATNGASEPAGSDKRDGGPAIQLVASPRRR